MQSVEHHEINGDLIKLFNKPVQLIGDHEENMFQIEAEMHKVSESGGHVEIFAGTPENIQDRSKLSRQSRRRLDKLEYKANKKRRKASQ